MAKFGAQGVDKLQQALDKAMRAEHFDAYFESAVQDLIQNGEAVYPVDIGHSFYAEIDCLRDLENVRKLDRQLC